MNLDNLSKVSILDVYVSCFRNYRTSIEPRTVNLLRWLTSERYKNEVEHIRALHSKAEIDSLKSNLPAVTASGIFTHRAIGGLIRHSGFIAIDVDKKGNEGIDFEELKEELKKIDCIAYCGLSVSGKGLFCLVPIAYPERHSDHFRALQEAFKKMGITIDQSCKDVSRLRGYSFDGNPFFNHSAVPFTGLKELPKLRAIEAQNKHTGAVNNKIDIAVKMIHSSEDGNKHRQLLKASYLIGGAISTGEVNETEAVQALEVAIQSRSISSFADAQITILKGIEAGKLKPTK